MSKRITFLLVFSCIMGIFAHGQQAAVQKKWKTLNRDIGFQKTRNYKGPNTSTYDYPSSIKQAPTASSSSGNINPYQGIPYTEQELKEAKSGGGKMSDPTVEEAEPIVLPEVNSPSVPNVEYPSGVGTFFKYFGIIVLLIALAYLAYYFIKNYQSSGDKSLPFEPLMDELNPEEISKTELQLRLEEALKTENYKECVRIYLLFSLKILIERKLIFWKKEKTNLHYIIELSGKPMATDFERLVSLYEYLWYGDYPLTATHYSKIEPELNRIHQSIEQHP